MSLLPALTVLGLQLVGLVLIGILIVWSFSLGQSSKTAAPFVPTRQVFIKTVLETLQLTDTSVFYELGAGDARILLAAHKAQPIAKYVGLEKSLFPYALGKMRIKKAGNPKNVSFLKKNIFQTNLAPATHIFAFLLPDLMDGLLPKFERELKSGTRLVSLQFRFTNKEPDQALTYQAHHPREKPRILYIYTF